MHFYSIALEVHFNTGIASEPRFNGQNLMKILSTQPKWTAVLRAPKRQEALPLYKSS